jgi:hypothetical protein
MSAVITFPRPPIEIAFTPRNEELIRVGLKRATTRRSQHGKIGDTFLAAGRSWEIRSVVRMPLWQVSQLFFLLEGEPSPEYFVLEWGRCYGVEPVQLNQAVYVHIFVEAPGVYRAP